MTAFDSDILVEILNGNEPHASRAAAIPPDQQAIPVVVIEEILRGRLNMIRRAEAGKAKMSLDRAYELFKLTLLRLCGVEILSYTPLAESLFQDWRSQKIRVATHDLRIAAICVAHSATLVSRNRRDFDQVPGLSVEYWE
jgi:tRNA(fMet)-specific endonuclease VapC